MYSASLDSVLFTHDQLAYCLCIVLSSVVNARYAGLHDQQKQQPLSLHTQEELSSLRQQVAESSVLRVQLEAAQQEAAHNQSRAKELYDQLDAMSRRHEQVTAALLLAHVMHAVNQSISTFSAFRTHQESQQTIIGQSAYIRHCC